MFGEPAVQVLFEIAPRVPLVGPVTVVKVSSHCWASLPDKGIDLAESSFVASDTAFAVGGVFAV